jgi:hypothetical protein
VVPPAAAAAARVTGLTLSKEQLAEATARVAAAGLSDKVTLLFCDYRYAAGCSTVDDTAYADTAGTTVAHMLQVVTVSCAIKTRVWLHPAHSTERENIQCEA